MEEPRKPVYVYIQYSNLGIKSKEVMKITKIPSIFLVTYKGERRRTTIH